MKYFIDSDSRHVNGVDMQKNKASEFAWNVAYRNATGSIRFKFAG